MFAPTWVVRLLVEKSDASFKSALESGRQLNAAILGAKDTEVSLLKDRIRELEAQVRYERTKADSLYDRLLIRDAKVAPVQAVAQAAALAEAQDSKKKITEELSRVFDQLSTVGEVPDEPNPQVEVTSFAGGGTAVGGPRIKPDV